MVCSLWFLGLGIGLMLKRPFRTSAYSAYFFLVALVAIRVVPSVIRLVAALEITLLPN